MYSHLDFLSLLEQQVLSGESPLTALDTSELDLNDNQSDISFGRLPTASQLTVQADNGDAASFDAAITQEDESVMSFVEALDSNDFVFGPQGKRLSLDSPQQGE